MDKATKHFIDNISDLSSEEKYDYFILTSVDHEQVWGIVVGEDNWVSYTDDGDSIFPIYPDADLAKAFMLSEHKEMKATPQVMSLQSFITYCIPDMIEEKIYFGVIANDKEYKAVTGYELLADLKSEIEFVES